MPGTNCNCNCNSNVGSLTVTMTNDPLDNKIQVYNTKTHLLIQTLRTYGKGGVKGNAFGIKQFNNKYLAVVNYGSRSVSVFIREGDRLKFKKTVMTSSSPVSIDFGYNHMYVAGSTTVDSFLFGNLKKDGSVKLALAEGGEPPLGSTGQISVVTKKNELLVTLKNDPSPGTVDVISLHGDGSLSNVTPIAAPSNTMAPFGFCVFEDGTALITLAHTNNLGLFRNNTFVNVINLGQNAPCWATKMDKYAFIINAGSRTISRIVSTGQNIFFDNLIAASITSGNPSDTDQNNGKLVVLAHNNNKSQLNFFRLNEFGDIIPDGNPVDINAFPNANGVSIMD